MQNNCNERKINTKRSQSATKSHNITQDKRNSTKKYEEIESSQKEEQNHLKEAKQIFKKAGHLLIY